MKFLFLSIFYFIIFLAVGQSNKFNKTGGIQLTLKIESNSPEKSTEVENIIRLRLSEITKNKINIISDFPELLIQIPEIYHDRQNEIEFLCSTQGKLEFWETYDIQEIVPYFNAVNETLYSLFKNNHPAFKSLQYSANETPDSILTHLLFQYLLLPEINTEEGKVLQKGPCLGYVNIKDTSVVNTFLNLPEIKPLFPIDFTYLWSVYPIISNGTAYKELIGIKNTFDKLPLIDENDFIGVKTIKTAWGGFGIELEMTENASKIWRRMTRENVSKSIAIEIDNNVYSYPWIIHEISNGMSQITGNYTQQQAEELRIIVKYKALPASVRLIKSEIISH